MESTDLELAEFELELAREAHARTGEDVKKAYKHWEELKEAQMLSGDVSLSDRVSFAFNNVAANKALTEEVKALFGNTLLDLEFFCEDNDHERMRIAPNFSIGYDSEEDVAAVAKGLVEFAEKFKTVAYVLDHGEEGVWHFADFRENGLSQHASYSLLYRPGSDFAKISSNSYGHGSEVFSGKIKDVLGYLSTHLWFGDGGPSAYHLGTRGY